MIEKLSGLSAGIDDPFAYLDQVTGQELQPHQREAVEASARLVEGVPCMKLVLVLSENWTLTPPRDLRALVEMAVVAEEAGFDAVMVSEHIVLGPSAGAERDHGQPTRLRHAR